jgi:hypothetical protein
VASYVSPAKETTKVNLALPSGSLTSHLRLLALGADSAMICGLCVANSAPPMKAASENVETRAMVFISVFFHGGRKNGLLIMLAADRACPHAPKFC